MKLDELQALLAQINGATFASIDTVTIPTLKGGKKNPFQGKVAKHCEGHRVMLFTNKKTNAYEAKVRRHLEREGKNPDSFVLGELPWGKRLPDSPIIEHNGKYYLQCVFLKSGSVEYRAKEFIDCEDGTWFSAGSRVVATAIQGLNERSGSEHQGLDNEVIVRSYALDSIKALRAFHEELN